MTTAKSKMSKFVAWYTPGRREALQLISVTILAAVATVTGLTDADISAWTVILAVPFQLISSLSNLIYLKKGRESWAQGWEIIRGAIYTAAGTLAPALALLGVFAFDGDAFMRIVSFALSLIGSLVALVTIEKQNPLIPPEDEE